MLKKLFPLLIICLIAFPVALGLTQDDPQPVRLQVTGVDATNLPTVVVTASVSDALGQPILGLTEANFAASVEGINGVVPDARIVSVENVADDNVPFSVVLMIDVSTSMEDGPFAEAQEAARTFVNSIGANDSVAIMTFSNSVRLVQDFTTDKDALLNAIDSLQRGGQTALYQAAYDAVQQALGAPSERRIVILLSDGAEYGGSSVVGRDAALEDAIVNGVPIYTIGLGYGADRTYLEALSNGTNAHFVESPTEDELVQIYGDLASMLRSQYIITLELPVPADGQQYTVTVEVTTDAGTDSASGEMRAPIPVPLVFTPTLESPVTELTTVEFVVRADDPIHEPSIGVLYEGTEGGSIGIESVGELLPEQDEYVFPYTIDPATSLPGRYTVTFSVTDEDGDTAQGFFEYDVAPLPSTIEVTGLPEGELDAPAEVTVIVLSAQAPTSETTVTLNGESVETTGGPDQQSFTIDPYTLPAGESTLTVTTTNAAGTVTTTETTFTVVALPPFITVEGLADGDEVTDVRSVTASFVSQAPIASVSWFIDSTELASQFSEPFGVTLDPLDLSTGEHTLNITATDGNGTSGTTSVTFTVPGSVAQTATALAPTATPTFTNTPTPTATLTPSPTVDSASTQTARDTAAAQFAADAQATSNAIGTVTAAAQGTIDAEVDTQATASAEAQATNDAANVQATTDAQATNDASQVMMTATAIVQATQTAEASPTQEVTPEVDVEATNAQATLDAANEQATISAQQTLDAANAQATTSAELTTTAAAQAALIEQTNAAETQTAADAQLTSAAQSTEVAQVATLDTDGTTTAIAQATQDRANQLTATAVIMEASQTAAVVETGQSVAQADINGTATAIIAGATQSAEALSISTSTAEAGLTLTAQVTPTRVPPPTLTPAGELTEVEAQGAPQNTLMSPLFVGCGIGIILLVIIFLILNRRRTRTRSN